MLKDIENAGAVLRDRTTTWVARRDAADQLGDTAMHALAQLYAARDESDVDVKRAVASALAKASAGLVGIKPHAPSKKHSLDELARACEKEGRRSVTAHEGGYAIEVSLKNNRRHHVLLEVDKAHGDQEVVRVSAACGACQRDAFEWALRANYKLAHGALAIADRDGMTQLVMTASIPVSDANPALVKAAVREVAFYADWLENRLTRLDKQ